jgi:hypothetical protein
MEAESESHAHFKFPPKDELISVVTDLSKPIAQRMRSIFYLRTLGGDDAVEALCKGERHSSALTVQHIGAKAKHVLARCCWHLYNADSAWRNRLPPGVLDTSIVMPATLRCLRCCRASHWTGSLIFSFIPQHICSHDE